MPFCSICGEKVSYDDRDNPDLDKLIIGYDGIFYHWRCKLEQEAEYIILYESLVDGDWYDKTLYGSFDELKQFKNYWKSRGYCYNRNIRIYKIIEIKDEEPEEGGDQ